jgi:acyl-CoA thioester hydrolase
MAPSLEKYPIILTLPVQWGDQDAFGHVNNTVYLRWSESARIEYMRRVGIFPQNAHPTGVGPILATITCDYKLALTYPDEIEVGARVVRIGNSSIQMENVIVSRRAKAVAAELRSTMVLLDYADNRPVRVPDDIREAIARLQGPI